LLKSEEQKSPSDGNRFFHQLADKTSEGQVVLRQGQEDITLQFPRCLILRSAVRRRRKER
jgi:hypothetical protein